MALCLNCGKKLRARMTARGLTMATNKLKQLIERYPNTPMWRAELEALPAKYAREKDEYGYDGRGHFCRGLCAQVFAETMAAAGQRLTPEAIERRHYSKRAH